MNRKLMPDVWIVPSILGLGAFLFVIGYWPDHSTMDGALAAVPCVFWTFLEWLDHRSEKKPAGNHFGLI